MFIRKFLNGLFAALFRPLAQVSLFTAAWVTFLLTAPFRIMGDAYYKSKTNLFRNLPRQNSRFSGLLKILAAFVAPPVLIVLMILINPVISFVQAYRNGFKSIFDTTWLTTRVLPLVKDYFSFKKLNSTLESISRFKPDSIKQGFVTLQNKRDLASMTESEQVAYVEKLTAEQDKNKAENKANLWLSLLEQTEAHSLSGILDRFTTLLNNDSPNQLIFFAHENNIKSLENIYTKTPLKYLSAEEINLLKDCKDDNVQSHLHNYTDLVGNLTCSYTSKSLNLITDPITIEFEAKSGESKKIYVCERAELQDHFRRAAENGQYPAMPQTNTYYKNLTFDPLGQMIFGSCDLFANVKANNMTIRMMHAANRFSDVRIDSGISAQIHTQLNNSLQVLRNALPPQHRSSQTQAATLLNIDLKQVHPNSKLPTDSNSVKPSKTKFFASNPTAKKDASSPHCFKNPFRKSAT